MSLVRVGMSENQKYGDGYDAIFGRKKAAQKPVTKPLKPKKPAKKTAVRNNLKRKAGRG